MPCPSALLGRNPSPSYVKPRPKPVAKEHDPDGPNTFLGGSPMGVLVRLAVLSLVVGVILSALGITPDNIIWRIRDLLQRIYDLGFGAFKTLLGYLLLGAIIVVPIWLISRLAQVHAPPRPVALRCVASTSSGFAAHVSAAPADEIGDALRHWRGARLASDAP